VAYDTPGQALSNATRMDAGRFANQTSFKEGRVGMGGRPKGSRNRVQVDLASLIVGALIGGVPVALPQAEAGSYHFRIRMT
jgi:hypothetical protein